MTVSRFTASAGTIPGRPAHGSGRRHSFCRVSCRVAASGMLLLMSGVAGEGNGLACHHPPAPASHASDVSPDTTAPEEKHNEPDSPDLSGTWEIHEEKRTYIATLDAQGNGPYTHQGGSFTTTDVQGRVWSGTWRQTGNDREGGFEVQLSEDGCTAEGTWWYTRVGLQTSIPPRFHGGSYFFKRLPPTDISHPQP